MSEAQRFETEEFLAGARRMVSALSQMDGSKIQDLERRAEAIKAELKKATTDLNATKDRLKGELEKHRIFIQKEVSEHNKAMLAKRKEHIEEVKKMNLEITGLDIALNKAIERNSSTISKMQSDAETEKRKLDDILKNLERDIERFKSRIANV